MPFTHGGAGNLPALTRVDGLHEVEGQVVLPTAHHRFRQKTRSSHAPGNGKFRRGSHQHLDRRILWFVLRHVLPPNRAHAHQTTSTPLHLLGHILPDAHKCVQPCALHVLGNSLYVHLRQVLWNAAPRGLLSLVAGHNHRGLFIGRRSLGGRLQCCCQHRQAQLDPSARV